MRGILKTQTAFSLILEQFSSEGGSSYCFLEPAIYQAAGRTIDKVLYNRPC